MSKKPDPYEASAALIANAIGTAKVLGENSRITGLVVSSVGRFAAELDAATEEGATGTSPGRALLQFALTRISAADAPLVPKLHGGLFKLLSSEYRARPPSISTTASLES
ncbi:MAG TPA: hypothetical protein VGK09_10590 [Rhodocyclaceae bacterium]|jgi:hypothetical protein